MAQSIVSYDYSEANIVGWLAAQELEMPSYQELLSVADLQTVSQRAQALDKWELFKGVNLQDPHWVSELVATYYDNLQIALPTRYGLTNHSYITDFVWLSRWMTKIRSIARELFLAKGAHTDREYVSELFSIVLRDVPVPTDLQSAFILSFEESLKRPLTLISVEFALDRASLAIQTQHVSAVASHGIRQWILLQAVLLWVKQYSRALALHVPEPVWEEWFPVNMLPSQFESYESLVFALTSALAGGSEWVVPAGLLDTQYAITVDTVALEKQIVTVLAQFLNQSVYVQDPYLQIMRHVYEVKMCIETAGFVVHSSLPNRSKVAQYMPAYDQK